jgi:hypothetical protein
MEGGNARSLLGHHSHLPSLERTQLLSRDLGHRPFLDARRVHPARIHVSVFVENLACRRMTVGGLLMRVGDAGLSKQQAASIKAASLHRQASSKDVNSHHYNSATNPTHAHTELQREHHPLTPRISSAGQSTLARMRGVGYRQHTAPSQSATLGARTPASAVDCALGCLVDWCLTMPQSCV